MSAHKFDPKVAHTTESDHSGGGSDNGEGEQEFDRARPGLKYTKEHLFTTMISASSSLGKLQSG